MLERLGGVTSASRAYIFKNSTGPDGEILSSQRFEWCRLGTVPQIDNQDLQEIPLVAAGYQRWIHQLGERGLIAGRIQEFPESERALLESQDILSLAVAPIFVEDRWWGLIGFDDCRRGRRWSGAELLALQTAADILGAALLRQRIQGELERANAELKKLTARLDIGR
jgi:GAF domain-containing protein